MTPAGSRTSSTVSFATKADTFADQARADVVVDLAEGEVTKNRFGKTQGSRYRAAKEAEDEEYRRLSGSPRFRDTMKFISPMVLNILQNWNNYTWTLQGLGMLRTYVSRGVRLHVWNSKFRVPDVTQIHDHPWHFESLVVSGRIVNTRYQVEPCSHTLAQIERAGMRQPFVKARIKCGAGSGEKSSDDLRSRGELVWLQPVEPPMTYEAGRSYMQTAKEVHHTSYDDGTVTLVHREFTQDPEHAHVFFRADQSWVSAEPRVAGPDEISAIVNRALVRFGS